VEPEASIRSTSRLSDTSKVRLSGSPGLILSGMGLAFPNQVFRLPNARRMIVEQFGVRIIDKQGNTILESGPRKEIRFDRSLSEEDRRLLSDLKITVRA
jgi:hypothetical protein